MAKRSSKSAKVSKDTGELGYVEWSTRPHPTVPNKIIAMRTFEGGATRDVADNKLDYEGFLSPIALHAFATYMHFNRHTANGMRASDNWQKGIPLDVYMKSAFRHFNDWWREHRGLPTDEGIVWAMLGLYFNLQGYLHEYLKENDGALEVALAAAEFRRAEKESKSGTE